MKITNIFGGKNKPGSRAYKEKMASELSGQIIKYITVRKNGTDEVVGRGGAIVVRGEEFLLSTPEKNIMRTSIYELEASYLMSNDGVVLKAPNAENGGRVDEYIAHFVYYRK